MVVLNRAQTFVLRRLFKKYSFDQMAFEYHDESAVDIIVPPIVVTAYFDGSVRVRNYEGNTVIS